MYTIGIRYILKILRVKVFFISNPGLDCYTKQYMQY